MLKNSFVDMWRSSKIINQRIYPSLAIHKNTHINSITSLASFKPIRLSPNMLNFMLVSKRYQSSCPSGTKLNLDIYKEGPEPTALPDDKYPDWLWKILEEQKQKKGIILNKDQIENIAENFVTNNKDESKVNQINNDLKLRKKQLRLQNRKKIQQNNYLSKL